MTADRAPRVAALLVYPLKSGREVCVRQAEVLPWGLAGDRRWMVVDDDGQMVSARTSPALLHVDAVVVDGMLRLAASGLPTIEVAPPSGPAEPLTMFGKPLLGTPAAPYAHDWVRRMLGRDGVRLVWSADPRSRRPNPTYSRDSDSVSFADGYPLLLAATSSLVQLNDWLAGDAVERGEPVPAPLPMDRFRPNIVVEGSPPFAEDAWRRVRVGRVELRVAHGCARCVMTTVDRVDLTRGKEPIRTLARHRSWEGKTWFGQNLIPDVGSGVTGMGPRSWLETGAGMDEGYPGDTVAAAPVIRVGDTVEVLE